jgi:hypothetical protein
MEGDSKLEDREEEEEEVELDNGEEEESPSVGLRHWARHKLKASSRYYRRQKWCESESDKGDGRKQKQKRDETRRDETHTTKAAKKNFSPELVTNSMELGKM